MTNLSWRVLKGIFRSEASFLRCVSSEALNARADPNRLAMAFLALRTQTRG